jgi:hypothetical protein
MHLKSDSKINKLEASKRSYVPRYSLKKCHNTSKYPHIDFVIIRLIGYIFLYEH